MIRFVLLFLMTSMAITSSVFAGPSVSKMPIKKKCDFSDDLAVDSFLGKFELLPIEIQDHVASFLPSKQIEDCLEAIRRIQNLEQCNVRNEHNGIKYSFYLKKNSSYYDSSEERWFDEYQTVRTLVGGTEASEEIIAELPVRKRASALWNKLALPVNIVRAPIGRKEDFNLFSFSPDNSVFVAVRQQAFFDIKRGRSINKKNAIYVFDRKCEAGNLYEFDLFEDFFDDWDFNTLAVSSDGLVALAGNKGICVFQFPKDLRVLQKIEPADEYKGCIYDNINFNKQGTTVFSRVSDLAPKRELPAESSEIDGNDCSYELYKVDPSDEKNKKKLSGFLRENLVCTGRSSKKKESSISDID